MTDKILVFSNQFKIQKIFKTMIPIVINITETDE